MESSQISKSIVSKIYKKCLGKNFSTAKIGPEKYTKNTLMFEIFVPEIFANRLIREFFCISREFIFANQPIQNISRGCVFTNSLGFLKVIQSDSLIA